MSKSFVFEEAKKKGFTPTQLANKLGVSPQRLYNWDKEGLPSNVGVTLKLAELLKCDVKILIAK